MKAKQYTKKCQDCRKVFVTDDESETICSECKSFRKPHKIKKRENKKHISLAEMMKIERVYNKVNGTLYTYGKIASILENINANCCVCCGVILLDGQCICSNCEKEAERGQ